MNHNLKNRISVVLVEPKQSLNVGAVARAMCNLGFSDLRIVNPQYAEDKIWVTARSALEFVKLTEFIELKAAITDCNVAYGFSARDSFNRHARLSLQQATQQIKVENNLRTAAIFGPEATGLRKEHLDLCTQLVRIPSSTNFESFNLAQSTLLFMYELIRTQNDVLQESSGDDTATVNATINDLLQIEKLVDESARLSGFYGKGTPSHIPSVIHNLIKRTMPTENEASVLLGLFSKIRKALLGEIPINNE